MFLCDPVPIEEDEKILERVGRQANALVPPPLQREGTAKPQNDTVAEIYLTHLRLS